METQNNKVGYLIIGGIVAVIVAYNIGVSNGKIQYSQEHDREYTDEDYLEMKACYESVLNDKTEVDDITGLMGYGDTYEELASAVSRIKDIVSGKTVSVPRVPYYPESGYYDCE